MMASQSRSAAQAFLTKSQEYLASATDNMISERLTAASGDAIHAGICAKDAIVMVLVGSVTKHKDHSQATADLKRALGKRAETPEAERALRELVAAKPVVEYGTELVALPRARALVRRAQYLVNLAAAIMQFG